MGELKTASPRARSAGFTLIELLTVVVIVGVLAKIAAPAMQQLVQSTYVRSATTDLQTTLYFARSEAIKRATNVEVVACSNHMPGTCGSGSPKWNNGWIVRIAGGGATLRTQDALNSKLSDMTGSTITYRSDGRVVSAPSTIVMKTAAGNVTARCISIDLSGRPNVLVDTDDDPTNGCS